jgi:hypothetical protein
MAHHPLIAYLSHRRAARQARAWLHVAAEPDLIAAEALRQLNRHAYATKHCWDSEANRIYYLKRHALRVLFFAWPCRITTQTQQLACSTCAGRGHVDRGPHWDRYSDTCWRCGGTGIYKTVPLYAFDFTIADRPYQWHQPVDLCPWAARHVSGHRGHYEAPEAWHAGRLTDQHARVLIAALEQWLAPQLTPLAPLQLYADAPGFRYPTLRTSFAAEIHLWRTALHNLPRYLRSRWWRSRVRNALATRGSAEDQLPF